MIGLGNLRWNTKLASSLNIKRAKLSYSLRFNNCIKRRWKTQFRNHKRSEWIVNLAIWRILVTMPKSQWWLSQDYCWGL